MKKNKLKDGFLDHLRKIPIVQVAAEKSNLSRNTIYRWRKEDPQFVTDMDNALDEGEAFVNDMSESQLLNLIKEKSFPAVRYWLSHRNPKFRERIEITTAKPAEALTPEQEAVVIEALQLANLTNDTNHDSTTNTQQNIIE